MPRYIQQTAPNLHTPTRKVMVLSELTLSSELFKPQIDELTGKYGKESIWGILDNYDKWHILQIHAAMMDVQGRPRWYNQLLQLDDRPSRETVDILDQHALLDGTYLSRTEANTILSGIKLLGKETDDATRIYNGLDAIAYAAIMRPTATIGGRRT